MLEFYCAYWDYEDCMDVVEELIRHAAGEVGALKLKWGSMKLI